MVVSLDNNRENSVYFAVSKILVLKVEDGFSQFMMLIFFVKTALKTVRFQTNHLFNLVSVACRRCLYHRVESI